VIRVTRNMSIDPQEIREDFVHASGPGGQNVNKVATAVQLRFNVSQSCSLSENVRVRLTKLAGKRINDAGVLIIEARRFRSRQRNRDDAMDRLVKLLRAASVEPKRRRKTMPTAASRKRRLDDKRHRSRAKRLRSDVGPDEQ